MAVSKKAPSRRIERAFAFKVLYGLEFTQATSEAALLESFSLSPDQPENLDMENSYAWRIVKGVWDNQKVLDKTISSFSQNWRVERLGKVEAAILRMAFYELMQSEADVPHKVAINEAIELSKEYSDDRSKGFVNGVLDAAVKALESGKLNLL